MLGAGLGELEALQGGVLVLVDLDEPLLLHVGEQGVDAPRAGPPVGVFLDLVHDLAPRHGPLPQELEAEVPEEPPGNPDPLVPVS